MSQISAHPLVWGTAPMGPFSRDYGNINNSCLNVSAIHCGSAHPLTCYNQEYNISASRAACLVCCTPSVLYQHHASCAVARTSRHFQTPPSFYHLQCVELQCKDVKHSQFGSTCTALALQASHARPSTFKIEIFLPSLWQIKLKWPDRNLRTRSLHARKLNIQQHS